MAASRRELKKKIREAIVAHLESVLLDMWDDVMYSGYGDIELVGKQAEARKEVNRIARFLKVDE